MKNLLRASILLALILLLIPSASGQENGYPACSESEILVVKNSLWAYAEIHQPAIDTLDDLADHANMHIAGRDASFSLLPLCSTAIVTQRRVIAMYGDYTAGSALIYAGLPRSVNPYYARDLIEGTRISRAMEDLTGDPGEGVAPEERGPLRVCSREENDLLDDLVAEFLEIDLSASAAQNPLSLSLINSILAWRDEKLPLLPGCAQSIELGFLLNKATTDAAALLAFGYAALPEGENPYTQVVSQTRESLSTWRQDLMITQPQFKDATVLALGPPSELPPCTPQDLAFAHSQVQSEISAADFSRSVLSSKELTAFSQKHIALRNDFLSQLPLCAEVFELRWRASELLGDAATRRAVDSTAGLNRRNPFVARVHSQLVNMRSWLFKMEEFLADVDVNEAEPPEAPIVPECRRGEILFMLGYLMSDFYEFLDAAFDVRSWDALYDVYEASFAHRDELWLRLPRCREALEIGLVMRQLAGDWVAMLAMNPSYDSQGDILYESEIKRDLDLFETLADSLSLRSRATLKIYYVTANPYANIRSCAATSCSIVTTAQNGEALTVVDDSGDWYELRLDAGGTGYIAGFLMSKTPPDG